MDEGTMKDHIEDLMTENQKLYERIALLEDTNHMLNSECKRLSEELARTYV